MRLSTIIASVLLWAASTAHAQPCSPYWRAGPPMPPGMGAVQFDDGSGSTVYAGMMYPPRAYRWSGAGFELLPMQGLPAHSDAGGVLGLDDGTGPALYFNMRINLSPQGPASFKFTGNGWTPMPAQFYTWDVEPFTSVAFQGKTHIYGRAWITSYNAGFYRWNGSSWDLLAQLNNGGRVAGLFVHGDNLYMIGGFSTVAGVPNDGFVRWDGTNWYAVSGVGGRDIGGFAVAEFDDGMGPARYVTSLVMGWGEDFHPGVFKFDGQQFTPIGYTHPPPGSGWATVVASLRVFDDGRGPALYIGGFFPQFGINGNYVTCNNLVRWDGTSFEPVGAGGQNWFLGTVTGSFGNALMAVRQGTHSFGGGTTQGSAFWVGCPNCYVNCDLSTTPPVLNIADFGCFLQKFAANDPYANCNVDATIDIADFACFMQKFAAGCP